MNLKQIFLSALLLLSCAVIKSAENTVSPENQTKPTTQDIFAAFQKLMRENRALKNEVARLQEIIAALEGEKARLKDDLALVCGQLSETCEQLEQLSIDNADDDTEK